jgi:hypothetical protein
MLHHARQPGTATPLMPLQGARAPPPRALSRAPRLRCGPWKTSTPEGLFRCSEERVQLVHGCDAGTEGCASVLLGESLRAARTKEPSGGTRYPRVPRPDESVL